MIVMVQVMADPWVYVVGQVISTSIYSILTHIFAKKLPSLRLDFHITKDVISYCKYLLLIAIASFISVQFENYYIGFAFGAEALGYYFTWGRIILLPREFIAQFGDRILFVSASAARREGKDISRQHLTLLFISLAMIAPFYYFVWHHGGWFISVIAGDEWVEYLWIGQFFILISLFQLIALIFSPLVLSHFPRMASIIRSVEVILLVILIIYLGHVHGIQGVLIASLSVILLACFIRIYIAYRYIIYANWVWHCTRLLGFCFLSISILWGIEYYYGNDNVNLIPNYGVFSSYFICYLLTLLAGYKIFRGFHAVRNSV